MRKTFSSFEQGSLVVAGLLFSEQVGSKKRPALVISNSKYNSGSDDIILLKITSRHRKTKYDVSLSPTDLQEGLLKIESMIMVDNPVTTYKNMVLKKIGKISKQKLSEVKQKTKQLYGL